MTEKKKYSDLRSARWFAPDDQRSSGHRSRTLQMGYDPADWEGKPCIAIINTWSDAQPCHMHFKERVERVKRGVLQAGGFPLELPALSLSESYVKPTTMLYRNLLALETEELLRSHPIDGAVLMGGCDKTTPALVMGAVSAGLPFIYLPAGPMLRGNYAGKYLGSGTDMFKLWDERRAGNVTQKEWQGMEAGIARSYGHCMTMGTASTMTAIAEAMGLCLPGASSIPAADANHQRMSTECGRRIVDMVWEDLTPNKIITPAAVRNAVTVAMATGCSTNAIIHLIAMARRAGIPLELDDLDRIGRTTPVIANIRPSGTQYLMEDFFYAGGLRALMRQLGDKLDASAIDVTGRPLVEGLADTPIWNEDVIRPLSNPVYHEGSLAVLKGNLCPDGAVIKPAACDPKFHRHRGPALVADSYPELKKIIDDPDYPMTPDTVLVLRNAGPLGGPGMPEWGMIPMPKALMKLGMRDMVRISDARMSGTSFGACVLHVAPESFIGGPLALLRNGDIVELDIPARRLDMLVPEAELAERRAAWQAPEPKYERGYGHIFSKHVEQADKGCDFDFLKTDHGRPVDEPVIY
ncbi:L-arabinonate dehydratase [Pseudomonas sp. S 311-6]|uniref:Dihydroxy-acid dehydratase n=1 Tax=Kerstersia gyiorum TaxID=206506 RepID=A0A4V2F1I5_9BURK|nr:L-arabinonate dehydratase [Kerstersia gyiorum]AZV94622.1 dihydroxy-acid dehydratase [Bordetella sp. J329]MCO7642297.1 L-arabinonate dehydratase [Pseudomonas sp. S 311-6]KAB0541969.1 dihydroxy-acid dehydratase [Kerstersia gyiorum]MCR4160492.1 L-arabinonate dehydratase [Kerstersia gyiorum]RZS73807.1 dihydroxy-acid dehydratase [Kerstersia gyiorum]